MVHISESSSSQILDKSLVSFNTQESVNTSITPDSKFCQQDISTCTDVLLKNCEYKR